MADRTLAIRLAVVDGGKVKAKLKDVVVGAGLAEKFAIDFLEITVPGSVATRSAARSLLLLPWSPVRGGNL